NPLDKSTGNDPTSSISRPVGRQGDAVMFQALVKKTRAALAAETDPKKRKAIAARLSKYEAAVEAYKKEKHVKETHETEEGEEDEEDEESEESAESEEDEEEEESAKGNETDRKESDDDEDEPDDDGDEDDDEEEDDEAAAAAMPAKALALIEQHTGMRGKRAIGA